MPQLFSFDLFDTMLTRTVLRPADLFIRLGELLVERSIVDDAEAFAAARVRAEREARRRVPAYEVTLDRIYVCLAEALGWPEDLAYVAIGLELQLEREYARPVAQAVDQLRAGRQAGSRAAIVSDSYLTEGFLAELLAAHGVVTDHLLVSSRYGRTKASGVLFEVLKREAGPDAPDIVHIGDNWRSDVSAPLRLGLDALLFDETRPSRYERAVYHLGTESRLARSLLAGAMRAARVSRSRDDDHTATIWNVACNVTGPVLFAYVRWLLDQALAEGLTRLYFVAREGQILLKIARAIAAHRPEYRGIEMQYLYGSRAAWHLPAAAGADPAELPYVLTDGGLQTVRQLFERVRLDPHDFEAPLEGAGYDEQAWDRPLKRKEQLRIAAALLDDPGFTQCLERVACEARSAVNAYFESVGLLDSAPVGLVDIGWRGRLQSSFARIVAGAPCGPERVVGFYLGLYHLPVLPANHAFHTFLRHPQTPRHRDFVVSFEAILELFTAADHGPTVGYEFVDRWPLPRLKQPSNDSALAWGLRTQQEGVIAFVESYLQATASRPLSADLERQAAITLLERFLFHPSRREARVYGSLDVFEDSAESRSRKMAPKLSPLDTLLMLLTRGRSGKHSLWLPASLAQLGLILQPLTKAAYRLRLWYFRLRQSGLQPYR